MNTSKWAKINNREFLASLIILVIFLIIKGLSLRLPAKVSSYPIMMSNLGLVLTILLFARSCYRLAKGTLAPAKMFTTTKSNTIEFFSVVVMLVLYALLLDKIGFIISTLLFLVAFMHIFSRKKNLKVEILVAVGFTAVIFVSFDLILGVPLPTLFL